MNIHTGRRLQITLFAIFLGVGCLIPSAYGEYVIGRITDVDGQLLRYVPDNNDWLATVKDAPFGLEDALYTGQDSKAEINMPNNAWIRLGAATQIQLIAAEQDAIEISVSSGVARIYNESADTVTKASTPFGYVVAEPGSSFDLYVGDQSVEAIGLSGTVEFVHVANNAKYPATPGGASVIADKDQVGTGDGTVDADWANWNQSRDDLWAQRLAEPVQTVKYLPPNLRSNAYELEENGRWERVVVRGEPREMWRPTVVVEGWAPFTAGRWSVWYGDHTWIPDEPFGYVTHHYGNWEFVNGYWYWLPPPPVEVHPAWYPGRVAWVGSEEAVGWIPLAPEEPYYGHLHWGPAAIVATSVAVTAIAVASLVNVRHSVVVPQNNFYSSVNYTSVRNVHITNTTIINNFHASPVVNQTIIKNYNSDPHRFATTNKVVNFKPHQSALANIRHISPDPGMAGHQPKISAAAIEKNLQATRIGAVSTKAALPPPRITSKIVPANQASLPVSKVDFKTLNPKIKPVSVTETKPPGMYGSSLKKDVGVQPVSTKQTGAVPMSHTVSGQQDQSNGQHTLVGPRSPRISQGEAGKTAISTQGQAGQQQNVGAAQQNVIGPKKPVLTHDNINTTTTSGQGQLNQGQGATINQQNVAGPKKPVLTHGEVNKDLTVQGQGGQQQNTGATNKTMGGTPPPVSQTNSNKTITTGQGASGYGSTHTAVGNQGQSQPTTMSKQSNAVDTHDAEVRKAEQLKLQQQQAEIKKAEQLKLQEKQHQLQLQQAEQKKLEQQHQLQLQQAEQKKLEQQHQLQLQQAEQKRLEQQKLQQQQQQSLHNQNQSQHNQLTAEQLREICKKNPNDSRCVKH